jgi:hypothetical protein
MDALLPGKPTNPLLVLVYRANYVRIAAGNITSGMIILQNERIPS